MGGTPLNTPDPMKLMQAILAMRQSQGTIPGMSGIPGAAQPTPQPQAQPPAQPQAQQGGVPGAVSAPQTAPQGPARQLSPASPTPFNGTFGGRQGVISQLVNSAEKKSHDKKVNEAEMYYNQINSFLASGDPKDQAKAQQLLDDPKVRKILKTGLDYVPLEEEVPPEAIGVHQAQQKINQKQSVMDQVKKMLGGKQQQPQPQGKAVIPGPSQASQQAYSLGESKISEQDALAQMHKAEADADKVKADAETVKAKAERDRAYADLQRSSAEADWYRQQAKASKDKTPAEIDQYKMGATLKKAQAEEAKARGKYYGRMPQNKLPGQVIEKNLKSAQDELNISFREAIAENNRIQADMQKQSGLSKKTGGYFGLGADPSADSFAAAQKVKKFREAMAWFVGEGSASVKSGAMTVPQAVAEVAKRVGIDIPPPSLDAGDVDKSDDEIIPDRPPGVPDEAEWDPATRTWSVQ